MLLVEVVVISDVKPNVGGLLIVNRVEVLMEDFVAEKGTNLLKHFGLWWLIRDLIFLKFLFRDLILVSRIRRFLIFFNFLVVDCVRDCHGLA